MAAWRRDWNWAEAERFLRAAIAVDKDAATPHVFYAWLLRASGRVAQADAEMGRALELDPVSSFAGANAGLMLYFDRRYSDAIAHLRDTLTLDPHYALAYLPLGLAFVALGESDQAVACLSRAVSLAGDKSDYYRAVLGYAMAAGDQVAAARKLLANSRAFDRALVHLGLHETGPSIDCLEMALREQSSHVAYLGADPLFDRLRGEKRFQRLARSIGLP
jgi:tetratricopeptide (TPR) repeat protein